MKFQRLIAPAAILVAASGCINHSSLSTTTGGNAALFNQFAAFDGRTGERVTFADVARRANRADVVLFGESHNDPVCNALEAQLFSSLGGRPALAMEFFERDTQTALNDYLAGKSDEADMVKKTRQGKQYALSHRPLIEYCKASSQPVIAANTPRRYLGKFRESGLPFNQYRASLPAAEQAWLPRESLPIKGPYLEHWREIMKNHPMPAPASAPVHKPVPVTTPDGIPRGFLAQQLWDDTMAESIADHRANNPRQPVMLVVGSFHVADQGGTSVKVHERRPNDRTCTIIYHGDTKLPTTLDADDKGAADIVLYGITAPEK